MANDLQTAVMAPELTGTLITQEQRALERSLKPNPFTTYRDPDTGRWIVIKPVTV